MGEIAAANAILALLVPKPTENDFVGVKVTTKQKEMEEQREWDRSYEDEKEG